MQTVKSTISLEKELPKPDMNSLYFVDWEKVTNVNDLMVIIASLGISFSPHHPAWDRISGFVDYSNPISTQQPQQTPKAETPKFEKMDLPKLKTI
jgi:hypothetical protein